MTPDDGHASARLADDDFDLVPGRAVVLFDGVCNLCNAAVLFIIDRDPRGRFRFAPLQSDYATNLVAALGERLPEQAPVPPPASAPLPAGDTIVLIEDGRVYQSSDAALRICGHLRGPWPLLSWFLVLPRGFRDWVYDLVARNRYRWFGRTESCRIPTPELRERFLV